MILYGTGGVGIVVLDVLRDSGAAIFCCIDDDVNRTELQGVPIMRSADLDDSNVLDRSRRSMIVCIGDCERRAELVRRYPGDFGQAIHPTAVISSTASIGEGSVVFHNAVIQTSAKVGHHVIVNTAATVDHDCIIGDFVHIAPRSTLCGNVTVHNKADIGAGTTIIQGITIGEGAVIGAGSVVIRDIPAYTVAVGSPAKVIKHRQIELLRQQL